MNSLILRRTTRVLVGLTLLFSVFVLLRGHNEPGGGFIGGLIAASAFAIYAIAFGAADVRAALRVDPRAIAGTGLALAVLSGLLAAARGEPFLTGLWWSPPAEDADLHIGTPLLFDIGVYLVVLGSVVGVVLALEEEER